MSDKEKDLEVEDIEGMEDMDDVVELVDDEGNVSNFYHVATFDYKDETFVVFEPAEPNEEFEEGEGVVMQLMEDENGEDVFQSIESEEKMNEVFDEYLRLQKESEECGDDCSCGCKEGKTCNCSKE